LGKIYEKMLVSRLKFHLLPKMSTRQYGFMPQRSTEDSLYNLMQHIHRKLDEKKIIVLVSLDIEGAFDSAWWPAIRVRLAEEKCPLNLRKVFDSYLRNREIVVRYAGEECTKITTKGCVQGSIGGPILWNLLLDPLLKSLENWGEYGQAFADDVVLVFDGDTALEVQGRANVALEHVRTWGVKNKLKFAPQKTNAMVITRKLKHDTP
ncbi:reverse transcriptase family protein, partial [Acinetobacter baumannii]